MCCNVPAFIVTLGGLLFLKVVWSHQDIYSPRKHTFTGQAYISKPVGWVLAVVTIALLIMSETNKRRSMKYDLEVIPLTHDSEGNSFKFTHISICSNHE